ncbi:cytochrome b subunit of the bc complex [Zymobacter palmae]|uniref:Cytochrome b subunit of the bc complex n=1 Tax=Zymobacter palmae TaxID=33074 RepID=A0A348HDB1_9GAMM|nr:cytochrome b subunit of the bc complex [Zymobacter palmae]
MPKKLDAFNKKTAVRKALYRHFFWRYVEEDVQ